MTSDRRFVRTALEESWIPKRIRGYERLTEGEQIVYFHGYTLLLDRAVERAALKSDERALDVGTGLGELARRLYRKSHALVIGTDPSIAMIRGARRRLRHGDNIEYVRLAQPFLAMPFAAGTFDAVVSTMAFHHVRDGDKARALAELARILKPGGRLVLGDVLFESDEAYLRAAQRWSDELEEEYFARLPDMERLFKAHRISWKAEQIGTITWIISGEKAGTG